MGRKVYEGNAVLNIEQWIEGLKKLEESTSGTATRLESTFKTLDSSIGTILSSVKANLDAVAGELTAISTRVAQANQALTQGKQLTAQAQQQAQQQAQASAASARASRQATAAEKAELTALVAAKRTEFSQMARDHKIFLDGQLQRARESGAAQAQLERNLTLAREANWRAGAQHAAKQYQEGLKAQAEALRGLSGAGGDKQAQAQFTAALQQAKRDAAVAYEEMRAYDRFYTMEMRQNAALRTLATKQDAAERARSASEIARSQGQVGLSISKNFEAAREELKKVENAFNAIYRSGAQITQLGSMMMQFAQQAAYFGTNLIQSASSFDFWTARALAAVQAANDQVQKPIAQNIDTLAEFRDVVLATGRDIGVLNPEQVAQGWFTYQAALGGAITTTEELQVALHNANYAMKVSVATATEVTEVIQGTAAVLGEFNMPTENFEYVAATMSNVAQTTQASFSDIVQSMKYVGPFANRIGMDFGQVAASIAMLAENGVKGSMAGRLFTSWIVNLVKPTDQLRAALEELFQVGEGGNWEQFVFTDGRFDFLKFLENYTERLKTASPALREFFNANLGGKEAIKVFGTLAEEYDRAEERYKELIDYFNNPDQQLTGFSKQWDTVSQSIQVKMGLATYAFQELRAQLGIILAETVMPMLEGVSRLVYAFLDWAETHPKVAGALASIAVGGTGLIMVLGLLLTAIGLVAQGLAGIPIIAKQITTGWSLVSNTLGAVLSLARLMSGSLGPLSAFAGWILRITSGIPLLGGAMSALLNPVTLLIVAIGVFAYAWYTNWNGIRDGTADAVRTIVAEVGALLAVLGSLAEMLLGVFTGDQEVVAQGAEDLARACINAFIIIPGELLAILEEAVGAIGGWFEGLLGSFYAWGVNMMAALADGIMEGGASFVEAAASYVASVIASFFESFSPPKYGPLRKIDEWGRNLIKTFTEGMRAADLSAVEEVADRIAEVIKGNIETNLIDANTYMEAVGGANNLVDQMLEVVRGGGRVNQDFFSSLIPYLGEWYDYLTQIALAYQDVYGNERALNAEKERLSLIQQQRKEIESANQARIDALDKELASADGFSYEANRDQMVDPLTPEGQSKIRQMRQTLSQEEFQNWLNFQRRLWNEKKDSEDEALGAQEDAIQQQIDLLEKQTEAAKAQYEYYVKVYEYAQKMYDLQKEQADLIEQQNKKESGGGGAKAPKPFEGEAEELNKYLDVIKQLVGADSGIFDEEQLRQARGGDYIGAIGEASKQQEREQQRLDDLERENRKRKAEFEVQLAQATSKEEQDRIRKEKDAWDAAYRKEKSDLQERLQLTKDISEAAAKKADETEPDRIAAAEAQYQEEIKGLLGEQTSEIKDANQLKGEAGDLDQAQIKARQQLRDEERKLKDLQQESKEKQIEFERRIREAANDPEKIRRIKEEQDAWEAAYKAALAAQEARVEAARRAQQDLADEEAAQPAKGKGAGAGGGGTNIPKFGGGGAGGGFDPEAYGIDVEGIRQRAAQMWKDLLNPPGTEQEGQRSSRLLTDLKRGIAFLGDASIPAKEKLGAMAQVFADIVKAGSTKLGITDFLATVKQIIEPLDAGLKALDKWADDTDAWLSGKLDGWPWKYFAAWFNKRDDQGQSWGWDSAINEWLTYQVGKLWQSIKDWFTGRRKQAEETADQYGDTPMATMGPSLEAFKKAGENVAATLSTVGQNIRTWATTTDETFNGWVSDRVTDFNTWRTNTGAAIQGWVTDRTNDFNTWRTNTGTAISTWVSDRVADFNTWKTNTGTAISTWVTDRVADFNTWKTNTGTAISTWVTDRVADFNTWKTETGAAVSTWVSERIANFNNWKTETGNTVSTWVTEQITNFNTWKTETGTAVTTWVTDRITDFNTWKTNTASIITTWATETGTSFSTWASGVIGKFKTWYDDTTAKVSDWASKVSGALGGVKDAIGGFVDWLASLVIKKPKVEDSSSGGKSPSGGSSKADGISYVPYDLYPAYLHQGERVLTAAEAAAYNALLSATKTASAAINFASSGVSNTYGGRKNTTINIGRIDAENPDAGRALLNQLAFLS